MLNQIILVGRLFSEIEVKETEKEKVSIINLAVTRNYKNDEGIYETDLVPITLLGKTGETTFEYCKKGDLIGIKGRIENKENEVVLIGEKVTFLSPNNKEGEE